MRYELGEQIVLNKIQNHSVSRQDKVDRWNNSNTIILIYELRDNYYTITVDGKKDDYWWDDDMINHDKTMKLKTNKKEIEIMPTERITFEKSKNVLKKLGVSKVVFNKPVVVVYLNDGRKGKAKCGEMDTFDEEVGFALAYTIAITSDQTVNKSNYKRHIDNLALRKEKKRKDCVLVEIK